MKNLLIVAVLFIFCTQVLAQNVGIGTIVPEGKLHIKGSADTSQLTIDANATQSNSHPLIRFRNAAGVDLMHIHSDEPTNTFIGLSAGSVNTVAGGGINNSFFGALAGYSNTVGSSNTATGYASLYSNFGGSYNTATGQGALYYTSGSYNTANGYGALSFVGIGQSNTAMGYQALKGSIDYSINTGSGNTAIGLQSLFSNTAGNQNTAVGFTALYSNTSGSYNTIMGNNALNKNTTGEQNVAMGLNALYDNVAGNNSTAIGTGAMFYSNSTATVFTSYNVAVGFEALRGSLGAGNNTGTMNTALGYQALWGNAAGYSNTATGYAALYSNWNGIQNTAMGQGALYNNVGGNNNVAMGYGVLQSNANGINNTGIGSNAFANLGAGSYNIAIGSESGVSASTPVLSNTISIGNHGYLNQLTNYVMIGNLSTAWNGGNQPWVTYASDSRVKDNVKEDVKGLDFILRLHPVTYNLNIRSMQKITGNKDTPDYPEKYDVEKIKQSGFLAQQVELAAKESGYDFSGVIIPKKSSMLYSLSYEQFVVPLVKAVQELKAMNDEKDKKITDMETRLKKLELLINK